MAVIVGTTFVRGDANDDGLVTVGDVIYIIEAVFQNGPAIPCLAAADVSGDTPGQISTVDLLVILEFLFLDGAEPPAPFPDCGSGESTRNARARRAAHRAGGR